MVGAFIGGLGGVIHAVVLGGSNPHITTPEFTLCLPVMVVRGGAGLGGGAVLGGFLYTYADARLVELSGSEAFARLPDGLRAVLSQPLFILGVLFILVVYFAPLGLTGLVSRQRPFIRRKETP